MHSTKTRTQIGKNYPVEVGVLGDTKSGLAELDALAGHRRMPDEGRARGESRGERCEARTPQIAKLLRTQIAAQRDARPMAGARADGEPGRACCPTNVAVIEEAVTTTNTTFERLGALKNTTGYFGHRGWALGWGLGCSLRREAGLARAARAGAAGRRGRDVRHSGPVVGRATTSCPSRS